MVDSSLETLIPMIDAIISASNPDEVSPKKIRKALQELYQRDLDAKRKALNELIIDRFEEIQAHPRMLVRKDEMMKRNQEFTKLLEEMKNAGVTGNKIKNITTRRRSDDSESKKKKKKKRKKERAAPTGTNSIATRLLNLSEPLSEIVGAHELPRTRVVKGVWDYIKAHNLQNPEDRREILCDAKMEKVFGKSTTMFQLNKLLVDHMHYSDEVKSNKDKSEPKTETTA
ncbi:similar to Saccharomyces cerevisiae YOR295W UAF30 Subunit of UAF (upstream activation factor) [Maudiozyma saulgeensis]|uniref:Similar to Saccharomyces cerevisiae YOR295W UAF30 Subunit of UAF (Upstream activation factor) n=1 Tax=Maudiozyma saulgeensis TaxID=1789683 RepID=A0A1X7RA35_9SACH|nr:similar to Saccharomyces cerevisiae YOR295W UAF30 Subunit of UAF (upstream activation factor) [Kazachstania saulgeensis]